MDIYFPGDWEKSVGWISTRRTLDILLREDKALRNDEKELLVRYLDLRKFRNLAVDH